MNKRKNHICSAAFGLLTMLLLAALLLLHSAAGNALLLVTRTDLSVSQLLRKLDFADAVFRFREEKSTTIYTPWRSVIAPVTWISGDFPIDSGELLHGRWPGSGEIGAVVLSEAQAVALFGSSDCVGRAVSAGLTEGEIVGVYRVRQSLPMLLSQPEGIPAYIMIADEPSELLAVRMTEGYDIFLAASEVKQQLTGNGLYGAEVENLCLLSAQTKGCIRRMLALILSLYALTAWFMLRRKRRMYRAQMDAAYQAAYFPASLSNAAAPFFAWLCTWLLPVLGLCACAVLFFGGIVVDPQYLPRMMSESAIWHAVKDALANLNSHRLPNAVCCNRLLWIQRLAKQCFVVLLLLYLPWWKEASRHAKT